MSKPGLRVYKNVNRADKELIDSFRSAASANVSDCTHRLFAMHSLIKPMGLGKKLVGSAITVKSAIADNALFHKALSIAEPGDVIVVNACSDTNHSVCGDVMYRYAMSKGIAGFVVDGSVRDVDFLNQNNFPVFALGATARGPYKNVVGEINTDIACGGQVVHPGDIIIGDEDGITVVQREDAPFVLNALREVQEKEAIMGRLIESGEWDEKSQLLQAILKKMADADFDILE